MGELLAMNAAHYLYKVISNLIIGRQNKLLILLTLRATTYKI